MSVITSNTTPINYLVLIDQINVLRHLYARVMIPQAVFGEVQDEGTPGKVKAWVASHPAWLDVRTVSAPLDPMLAFLDVGEREAISSRFAQILRSSKNCGKVSSALPQKSLQSRRLEPALTGRAVAVCGVPAAESDGHDRALAPHHGTCR